MEVVNRIIQYAEHIFSIFSESLPACAFLACTFGLCSIVAIRCIVSELFGMHRSKSSLKKIRKPYSFWQSVIMKPAWDECLHAKGFCRKIIICHHMRVILLFFELFLTILANYFPELKLVTGYCAGAIFLAIDIPILVMHLVLDRYPFQRGKHEYRFRKYHRSAERDRLF